MTELAGSNGNISSRDSSCSRGSGDQDPVRFLQYEVREGGEAGEVVVIPKAFIANCNGSFILQLDEEGLHG